MIVSELLDLLREYPADLRVVVNGYEEGYDDLSPRADIHSEDQSEHRDT